MNMFYYDHYALSLCLNKGVDQPVPLHCLFCDIVVRCCLLLHGIKILHLTFQIFIYMVSGAVQILSCLTL